MAYYLKLWDIDLTKLIRLLRRTAATTRNYNNLLRKAEEAYSQREGPALQVMESDMPVIRDIAAKISALSKDDVIREDAKLAPRPHTPTERLAEASHLIYRLLTLIAGTRRSPKSAMLNIRNALSLICFQAIQHANSLEDAMEEAANDAEDAHYEQGMRE